MDIKEIREKKYELEDEIEKLVQSFQAETSVLVFGVSVNHSDPPRDFCIHGEKARAFKPPTATWVEVDLDLG